ncbi:NfeD family protein [uncultured Pseudoteredinibacter sp.]|uniref:NfeD family protein n=1 Tax=uncultured Pseudoteredinibacter sp. TaxID=1641701 RepID=UPI002609A984|nr:NfeD family protein [uncultured Pseudoteredinibacter sp.]
MDFLSGLSAWHWLILGIVLLILEMLGAAGFLLGIGVGAILTAVIAAVLSDMSWQAQLLCFAVLSIAATCLYWMRFRHINEATDQPLLNSAEARLLGKEAVLLDDMSALKGKVQIADTLWEVSAAENYPAGTKVKVLAVHGMSLQVEAQS